MSPAGDITNFRQVRQLSDRGVELTRTAPGRTIDLREVPASFGTRPTPKNSKGEQIMKRITVVLFLALFTPAAICPVLPARAAEPIVYPAKGQSKDTMEKDKYACYQWAKEQTRFDPMQAPAQSAAATTQPKGGAVKGAAKGAAAGAVVGAVAGDAGKGAAIGAAAGGTGGAIKKRRGVKEQQAAAQSQAASADQQRAEYNRAWGACLEGKGYTVK
jgi:hypothetical protein